MRVQQVRNHAAESRVAADVISEATHRGLRLDSLVVIAHALEPLGCLDRAMIRMGLRRAPAVIPTVLIAEAGGRRAVIECDTANPVVRMDGITELLDAVVRALAAEPPQALSAWAKHPDAPLWTAHA